MKINFEELLSNLSKWVMGLSERTLELSAIAVLHCAFLTNLIAYMNAITDKTPSLDAYLLVSAALFVMNVRAIIRGDKISTLIHSVGFVSQVAVLGMILLK